MFITGVTALPATATTTPVVAGGVSAPTSATGPTGATGATGATGLTLAPVTARTPVLKPYTGPLFERTATGQVVPYASSAQTTPQTGGAAASLDALPDLLVPGSSGVIVNGLAVAPLNAPLPVQNAIWAGNELIGKPYLWGGGHDASFIAPGYDCSGTVSFALHGGDLLSAPLDSSEFEGWGSGGRGVWITIFTNPEHAYVDIAGLRLDTSAADDPSNEQGPRWRPLRPANAGFAVRHPTGF
jgi:cell wall-associated NlpC family hydrolase